MKMNKKYLWINYGGSCRKLNRDIKLLKEKFGKDFSHEGTRSMDGHWSNCEGIVSDTQENREWIRKQKGISISRKR